MQENPFRPTFGVTPPEIIGRKTQMSIFLESLERGIGHPHRSTIFIGARGMGKTVILNELAKESLSMGWVPVRITANPAMLDDAIDQINAKAAHLVETGKINITRVSAAGFGLSFSAVDQEPLGWRQKVTNKIEQLGEYDTGLLFLIDEVHAREPNLRILLTAYQHLLIEERKVAIALAGLPHAVSDLLNVDVITFLRRAYQETLRSIALPDVADGLAATFSNHGKTLSDDALALATEATAGYPYLIQMVGYQIWEQSDARSLGLPEAQQGIELAKEYMANTVHRTALADLSTMDRHFLAAMVQDDGPSKSSDIATRLGKDANYVSQYRRRLLEAGVIFESSFGYVDFAIPLLREFLRG